MQRDLSLCHVNVHLVDVGECAQALDDAIAASVALDVVDVDLHGDGAHGFT